MNLKDLLRLCGRIGLTIAAFAFVAGIVASPLLQKVWSSRLAMMEQQEKAVPAPPEPPVAQAAKKQG